VQDKYVQFGRE